MRWQLARKLSPAPQASPESKIWHKLPSDEDQPQDLCQMKIFLHKLKWRQQEKFQGLQIMIKVLTLCFSLTWHKIEKTKESCSSRRKNWDGLLEYWLLGVRGEYLPLHHLTIRISHQHGLPPYLQLKPVTLLLLLMISWPVSPEHSCSPPSPAHGSLCWQGYPWILSSHYPALQTASALWQESCCTGLQVQMCRCVYIHLTYGQGFITCLCTGQGLSYKHIWGGE